MGGGFRGLSPLEPLILNGFEDEVVPLRRCWRIEWRRDADLPEESLPVSVLSAR